MTTHVSVLGTGRMGSALARAFLQAGHPTTVWNRSVNKTAPLAALGATVAADIRAAVAASNIIVINVSDYAATASVLRGADVAGALSGKLIVELTSGTPTQARAAARRVGAQGAHYLDGAILATPDIIGTAGATILVSGAPAVFESHKETLLALGGVRHVGEDPGLAAALESIGLSQLWGGMFSALHAVALAQAEGVALATLEQQWKETAPVVVGLVTDLIQRTQSGRLVADKDTLSTVSAHHGALHHLEEVTRQHGLDPALVEAYGAAFARAVAAGHLHDDFAIMTRFTAKPA